jgi:uncharacterized protein YndB with AHSA1/START domain
VVALGTLEKESDGYTVRLVVTLPAPPDEVWTAITVPASIERWLAAAEFDARPDGAVNLLWPGESEMHGVIAEIDPPRRLRYSWFEREYTSQLSFDVESDGDGTSRLTLTHRAASEDDAPGFGAGWHSHLESLSALLAGEATSKATRDARYEELRPAYDELLAAT